MTAVDAAKAVIFDGDACPPCGAASRRAGEKRGTAA
jgi:hypothetical protein